MPASHQPNRRIALAAAVAAAGSSILWPMSAASQPAWPNRTIKIIEPTSPGTSTDLMARMLAGKLSERIGQPFIVENKPGAGLSLGTDAVAKATPDGHTLLLSSTGVCVNAASGKKLPFDLLRDLAPIGQFASTPLIIVVPSESPIRSLRDLVDQARAKADTIHYSSSGIGSMSHIGMELLGSETKTSLRHVPYRSVSLAIPDLLSGQVQVALGTVATYLALLETGKLRALAVTSTRRSPYLPNVPTTAEAGYPGYVIEFTFGLLCPRGTPASVVRRLNTELNAIAASVETRELLARFAAVPTFGTPAEYGQANTQEVARWSKLIVAANIKVE
ncbi:Bug family tripartite tricarboxylate transporter substrate binding protein [Variovorax saccharolyticus]|uniref:Bug family tripartite tricarboxylate transporter substrate binding protein n=1 Tax=Variovorax saccharolyticus TaxID=3053516 RepID=UPI002576E8B4|nr:tripartite tricarboxylate transporter substrate binding protein [Variovorax sp. J22R187]MDM0021802.1 tripartite tricarboxylate transporter substrate binding protein [Variovorax sp. J22R187]